MSERTDRLAAQGRLAVLAGEMVALMGACGPGWGFRSPAHRLGFDLGLVHSC